MKNRKASVSMGSVISRIHSLRMNKVSQWQNDSSDKDSQCLSRRRSPLHLSRDVTSVCRLHPDGDDSLTTNHFEITHECIRISNDSGNTNLLSVY